MRKIKETNKYPETGIPASLEHVTQNGHLATRRASCNLKPETGIPGNRHPETGNWYPVTGNW